MRRKLPAKLVIVFLTAFLVSPVFAGQAYASWGAAKLAQLQGAAPIPAPVLDPVPTQPSPVAPTTPPTPQPPAATPPAALPAEMSAQETQMLQQINEERAKNGLKPLIPMPKLNELARLKSQDIIAKNYFSHNSPTYGYFTNMVYNAGIRFYSVGENLAKARDGRHAHILLMASEGHRKNILNPNFTHIGLGIIPDKYGVVVTQLFIMQ